MFEDKTANEVESAVGETVDATLRQAQGNSDLQSQLDEANKRAEDNYNKYLYALADLENYKKRIERQFREIADSGRRELLKSLLPVIDNLERALAFEDGSGGLRQGVEQTLRGFETILSSQGVKPIAVKGEPFNPAVAEAVESRPTTEAEDQIVLEEMQKGYAMGDDVIRPAKVVVAKNE